MSEEKKTTQEEVLAAARTMLRYLLESQEGEELSDNSLNMSITDEVFEIDLVFEVTGVREL